MKKISLLKIKRLAAVILCLLLAVTVFSYRDYLVSPIRTLSAEIGRFSALSLMPQAAAPKQEPQQTAPADAGVQTTKSQEESAQTTRPSVTSPETTVAAPTTGTDKVLEVVSDAAGKIYEQVIGNSGATNHVDNVYIRNTTGKTVDFAAELEKGTDVSVQTNAAPQVLIVHTHATECFFPGISDVYSASWPSRSTDNNLNMISIGAVVAKRLNEAGIMTVQATVQHDKDAYNGSYDRSRETIQSYLEKYPSIQVILDLHRDAITSDNGTKTKPTVTINGKKAAQLMIVSGCESGSVTNYPDWIYNLRFALQIQKTCSDLYPSLARPLMFASRHYNQDITHGTLLIEMGSEANTHNEVVYTAELLSDVLVRVFNSNA